MPFSNQPAADAVRQDPARAVQKQQHGVRCNSQSVGDIRRPQISLIPHFENNPATARNPVQTVAERPAAFFRVLALALEIFDEVFQKRIGKHEPASSLRAAKTQDLKASDTQYPSCKRPARIIFIELHRRNSRDFLQQVVGAMPISDDRSDKSRNDRLSLHPVRSQRLPGVRRQLPSRFDILAGAAHLNCVRSLDHPSNTHRLRDIPRRPEFLSRNSGDFWEKARSEANPYLPRKTNWLRENREGDKTSPINRRHSHSERREITGSDSRANRRYHTSTRSAALRNNVSPGFTPNAS